MMIAESNAVNLTDGLDGLAAGTVAIVCSSTRHRRSARTSSRLRCSSASIAGACIGFLWYNSYPADIFMGDTGSLGLGAAIAALAVITKTELLLVLIGGIYVAETLSVVLQVASFKLTGKRIFRMAPLHHHFEMKGWSETKVMVRFWIITGIMAGLGFAIFFVQSVWRVASDDRTEATSSCSAWARAGEAAARYLLARVPGEVGSVDGGRLRRGPPSCGRCGDELRRARALDVLLGTDDGRGAFDLGVASPGIKPPTRRSCRRRAGRATA